MNRFPSPNRLASLLYPFLVILGIGFVLVLIYGFVMHEEYDEDDEVTITFNCTQVLSNKNNYPDFVVNQCVLLKTNQ